MRRKDSPLLSAEVAEIQAEFRKGVSQIELRKKYHRSWATIKGVVEGTKAANDSPEGASSALVIATKPKQRRQRRNKELELLNKTLDASFMNALEKPLAQFFDLAAKRLPNAHTIILDLVNRRARALMNSEVELLVGGRK